VRRVARETCHPPPFPRAEIAATIAAAGVNNSLTTLLDLFDALDETERRASICFAAGRDVELDRDELNAALRRAIVVRAVGGDPTRELALEEDAVARLAEELGTERRRRQLQDGLESLGHVAQDRPAIAEEISSLAAAPEAAWHTFCAALLADAIGADE
jgi:hypothetical protein